MASAVEQFASSLSFSVFSKAEDLKKRLWFTLFALIVYRFGTYVPLPGINPAVIQEFTRANAGGILGILDMFTGGSIGRMTVLALSIVPYISSSIIIQLMTSVSPHLEALKKEGESGRRKLNQYTRYLTVVLASVQAYGISLGLEKIPPVGGEMAVLFPGFIFRFCTMVSLTGGTLFVVWLGEQITSRGIGNGISLVIYAGIVANLPQALISTLELGRSGAVRPYVILSIFALIAGAIAYIVFMEKAQRRIVIQYPKRQTAVNMPATSQSTHLPLKLNSSGVIPPIFASALLLLPATLVGFSALSQDSWLGSIAGVFSHGHPVYMILFASLIIFFSFFYTAIVFNPQETAENLRKSGAYIAGVRPGTATAEYLDYVLTRLTVIGAIYLATVCLIPEFVQSKVQLPFYFGGTSLLIVVSVTVDTISQIQSHLLAHQYEGLIKKAKLKGL